MFVDATLNVYVDINQA